MTAWHWHQMDDMQIICTSLQTDNHAVPHHSVFKGRMPFLPPNQQRQSTEGNSCHMTKSRKTAMSHILGKVMGELPFFF